MILVAAHNSTSRAKSNADFVCDGVDDQLEANAARAALGGENRTILFYEGDYNLKRHYTDTGCLMLTHSGTTIRGEGWGTRFFLEDDQNCGLIRCAGDGLHHVSVEDLYLNGNRVKNSAETQFETCGILLRSVYTTPNRDQWVRRVFAEEFEDLCVYMWGDDCHIRDSEFGAAKSDVAELCTGSGSDIKNCVARIRNVCGYVFGTDEAEHSTISGNVTHIHAGGEITQAVHRLWPGRKNSSLTDNTIIVEPGGAINMAVEARGLHTKIVGLKVFGQPDARPKLRLNGSTSLTGCELHFCDIELVEEGEGVGLPLHIDGNTGTSVTLPSKCTGGNCFYA